MELIELREFTRNWPNLSFKRRGPYSKNKFETKEEICKEFLEFEKRVLKFFEKK